MNPPRRHPQLFVLCLLLLLAGAASVAQQVQSQQQDEEFARLVREWTTRPEFLSPLVDHLPKAPGVPSPKDVLGDHIGAPKKLHYYAEILNYYRALAAKSPRVRVLTIGTSDEGRECVVVAVGSEDSIKNLDRYRAYLGRLADPRGLTEAQAREIIAKAKPVYHLMGGLHSMETGPPEMLMELAYRLAVEDSALIRQIRDHVIVTITPVAEPDGRDKVVDWYFAHKIEETGEDDSFGGPPYWGRYVFHDNNRDINYSQVTMRNLLQWYLQWHPPIMHDLHESVPFLYTFSGQAPQNASLDPILYGELPMFANFEMSQMAKYGMPGVWTHAFVDMWSPGYLAFMSSNHNGMIRMYETFGNGGANTVKRNIDRDTFGGGGGDGRTGREWYRPWPPYKEVVWSMRNNTNYMQTAVLSGLQLTSSVPKVVLENFYKKSLNSIEDGKNNPPHGFVIPAGQKDPTRVAWLVNLLRLQGLEVGKATSEITLKDAAYPAGSFVIKRDQPYGRLAKILLEKQNYPDANLRTYDDSAWTMGLMLQTDVKEIADKAILGVPVEAVGRVTPQGSFSTASGAVAYAVPHHGSNSMITLRLRLKDLTVGAAEQPFKNEGVEFPAGSFVIATDQRGKDVAASVRTAVDSLGLRAAGLAALPSVPMHDVDLPHIGFFSTWGSTEKAGWVRYALDTFEVPYELFYKERVKKGGLRRSFDVIIIPHQDRVRAGKDLVLDLEPKRKPLFYKRTDRFKFLGQYGESDDITGGMGIEGVTEFQKFLDEGGVLLTLGTASFFPADMGLTRSVDASRTSSQFYAPGPIVEAELLGPDHPLFYGYPGKTLPVRYGNGPLLQVPERDRAKQVLLKFVGGDRGVLSGLMKGANEVRDRPAIVDVPTGKGRVILYATNPIYRWQNHGEFNMVFNALLHYNDFPKQALSTPTEQGSR